MLGPALENRNIPVSGIGQSGHSVGVVSDNVALLEKGGQFGSQGEPFIGVFSGKLGKLMVPKGSSSGKVGPVCLEVLLGLVELSLASQCIFQFFASVGLVSQGIVFSLEGSDLFLEFFLSDFGSSQSFFQIFNPLLKFDDIALSLMHDRAVIEGSLSALEVLGGVFDSSSQQSVDLVLDEKEPSIELVSLLPLDRQAGVGGEEIGPELKEGVSEGGQPGVVTGACEDDSVVQF